MNEGPEATADDLSQIRNLVSYFPTANLVETEEKTEFESPRGRVHFLLFYMRRHR